MVVWELVWQSINWYTESLAWNKDMYIVCTTLALLQILLCSHRCSVENRVVMKASFWLAILAAFQFAGLSTADLSTQLPNCAVRVNKAMHQQGRQEPF